MDFRTIIFLMCLTLMSCAVPKAVEEHHYHHYEADTAAVRAQVDRQLTSWQREMQSVVSVAVTQQLTQQQQHENQRETINELITVTTDSLGRTMRQEQRTISRDITRELQQQEQRIMQEYEARLRVAVDSVGSIYQQRYDSLASRISQLDTTLVKKTPVGDSDRRFKNVGYVLVVLFCILYLALFLWGCRNYWWPTVQKLLSFLTKR